MSFSDVLAELPALSLGERQMVIRRALELDDSVLSQEDEALVEERLAAYRANPEQAVNLAEMKDRIRKRFPA